MRARGPFRPRALLRAGLRDESGGTLVEFGIVVAVFLLILFALIDFGRLGYSWVMADKAMQRAARIAAVRPPVCAGVPETNERNPDSGFTPEFGTSCDTKDVDGNSVCMPAATASCTGDEAATADAIATKDEIWATIQGLMPPGTTIANVSFSYDFDSDLGFLGGPYTPVVTTELVDATFQFTTPLAGLAAMAGATDSDLPMQLTMPPMSVSLPAEDLAQGNSG